VDACFVNRIDLLNGYLADRHREVSGWLAPADMVLMACAGLAQEAIKTTGDICEIGVFNGKSLVLLSLLLDDAERAIGIDYFEDDTMEKTRGHLARLSSNADRVVLHKTNTLDLDMPKLESLISRAPSIRYLHVDGGHEYFEVLHDLLLFTRHLVDAGIIVMDDYHDREYPGVNLALEHFCARDRSEYGFVPFMEGHNKVFLCRRQFTRVYQDALISMPAISGNSRISCAPGHGVLVPFSRFPMPAEDIKHALAQPAHFALSLTTTLGDVNRLARSHGSGEMVRSMVRAGKTTKDLL
jgi:hypothetical protein